MIVWFDPSRILSYNRMLNFVIGNRGGGKTFNTLELCIRRFLSGGHQFLYLRRYESELDLALPKLFKAVEREGHFPDTIFAVKGNSIFINDKEAGFALPLSRSRQFKGSALPDTDFILFDEFLMDEGRTTYIRGEINLFLDVIETVGRMRPIRVMCLSNAITAANIYFEYFGIKLNRYAEFTKHPTRPIIVQQYCNSDYIAAKKQTEFGKLIEGTRYGEYAIENRFVKDSYSFIGPMEGKSIYIMTFVYNAREYGVYFMPEKGIYHINRKYNPSCEIRFVFTTEDHNPNYLLFKSSKTHPFIKRLMHAYEMGYVLFDGLTTKNDCYELFDYL